LQYETSFPLTAPETSEGKPKETKHIVLSYPNLAEAARLGGQV